MIPPLLRRRLCLAAALLAVVVTVCVPHAFSQGTTAQGMPTTQTDDTLYSFSGQVVNSVTGEPIIRALVQIMGKASPRAAFTDREGRFTFAKMQAMTGALMAVKPGFYGTFDGGRNQMVQQRVTIGPGEAGTNGVPLVIKLVPESGITGQITDENGEPLENVRVGVTANVFQNGRKRLQRAQQAQTDEQGEFHLNNLPPGQYFLSAGPVWTSSADNKSGNAAMYFPGVAESTEAQLLDVAPGQNVHADLALPPAKTFVISGSINGTQPGFPQIVNQSGDQAGNVELFDQNTGKFSARVTCTVCTIKTRSGNPREDFQYGELTLTVNEDKHDVHVPMSPVSVPVKIEYQSSKPDFVTANGDTATQTGQRGGRRPQRNSPVSLRLNSLSKLHNDAFTGFGGNPDSPEMFLQNIEFGK